MDFDFIEGLTEEQIKNYYEEIMESSENNFVSGVIWEVECSNGRHGFYFEPSSNQNVGYAGYTLDTYEGWSTYEHCRGIGAYHRVIAKTDATQFSFWKVECSDGRTGFYVETGEHAGVGYCAYGVDTQEGLSMYEHCRGVAGYHCVLLRR